MTDAGDWCGDCGICGACKRFAKEVAASPTCPECQIHKLIGTDAQQRRYCDPCWHKRQALLWTVKWVSRVGCWIIFDEDDETDSWVTGLTEEASVGQIRHAIKEQFGLELDAYTIQTH